MPLQQIRDNNVGNFTKYISFLGHSSKYERNGCVQSEARAAVIVARARIPQSAVNVHVSPRVLLSSE